MSIKYDENKVPYIDLGGGYQVRLETEEIDDDLYKEKAASELRESPENMKQGMMELRELLAADKDLHVPIDDDGFLIKFLRPCKYYANSAFERLKKYYKFKIKYKKVCDTLMPESVRHVFEQELVSFQPRRDQHGRRILQLEAGKKWKPSKCSIHDLFRSVQLGLEAGMIEPRTQINGVIVLLDMEGLALSQVMQFTPSFAAMVLEWVQECVSARVKAVHIVNNSMIFNMLFAIFKPFIGQKLRQRIFFHNKDWNSLTSHVDKSCLRKRYGGTIDAPETPGNLQADLMALYNDDFALANSYGYTSDNNNK